MWARRAGYKGRSGALGVVQADMAKLRRLGQIRPGAGVEDVEALMTTALAWAEPGDVVVLPIHITEERDVAIALLNRKARQSTGS